MALLFAVDAAQASAFWRRLASSATRRWARYGAPFLTASPSPPSSIADCLHRATVHGTARHATARSMAHVMAFSPSPRSSTRADVRHAQAAAGCSDVLDCLNIDHALVQVVYLSVSIHLLFYLPNSIVITRHFLLRLFGINVLTVPERRYALLTFLVVAIPLIVARHAWSSRTCSGTSSPHLYSPYSQPLLASYPCCTVRTVPVRRLQAISIPLEATDHAFGFILNFSGALTGQRTGGNAGPDGCLPLLHCRLPHHVSPCCCPHRFPWHVCFSGRRILVPRR